VRPHAVERILQDHPLFVHLRKAVRILQKRIAKLKKGKSAERTVAEAKLDNLCEVYRLMWGLEHLRMLQKPSVKVTALQ